MCRIFHGATIGVAMQGKAYVRIVVNLQTRPHKAVILFKALEPEKNRRKRWQLSLVVSVPRDHTCVFGMPAGRCEQHKWGALS